MAKGIKAVTDGDAQAERAIEFEAEKKDRMAIRDGKRKVMEDAQEEYKDAKKDYEQTCLDDDRFEHEWFEPDLFNMEGGE